MGWRQYCIVSRSATASSCTTVVVCMYGLAPGVALMTCCLSVLDTGQIASIIGTALPTSSNFFINYAIVQVGWESLIFITAVVASFLCNARQQPADRAPLHPRGSVFQNVHCSVQALAIVVRPDFLLRCLIAERAPDAYCHHAFTTINAGLHLGSRHIIADMIVSSAHVQPFRFMFPHMGAIFTYHATWDRCLPLKFAMMTSVARASNASLAGVFPWIFRACGLCSESVLMTGCLITSACSLSFWYGCCCWHHKTAVSLGAGLPTSAPLAAEPPTKRVEYDRLWPHSARGAKEIAFIICASSAQSRSWMDSRMQRTDLCMQPTC